MVCHLSNTAHMDISPKGAPPLSISSPSSFPSQLLQTSVSSLHISGLPPHSLIHTVHEGATPKTRTCDAEELQEMMGRRSLITRLVSSIMVTSGQGLTSQATHAREGAGNGEEGVKAIHLELRKVLKRPKAAGILRLVFHDAGTFNLAKLTGGMNGSIIYELDRPENAGLDRPIKILDMVKASLDKYMQVSWADLIAVAGAEAVAVCGGPQIPVKLGRLDAVSADPEGELPAESLNASSLKSNFLGKGFK